MAEIEPLTKLSFPRPDSSPAHRSSARTLMRLRADDCRWPLGDRDDGVPVLFCAEPALEGKPYCEGHCRTAYVPAPRLKVSA